MTHPSKADLLEQFKAFKNNDARADFVATVAHNGQKRKYTGDDYIEHPRRVARRVASHPIGVSETVRVAAILHDVVEDSDWIDLDMIRSLFDDNVANLINELTNPSKGVKASRAVRKQIDRDHLKKVSKEAKVIKLIDRIDNLNEMVDAPEDFKTLYARESRLLAECLRDADTELYNELLEVIDDILKQSVVNTAMGINGLTQAEELNFVYDAAKISLENSNNPAVALGCFNGRSTSVICGVYGNDLIAIDNFKMQHHGDNSELILRENLEKLGYNPQLICSNSSVVPESVKEIGFLFIDTDHHRKILEKELNSWAPLLVPGGVVVLHDYGVPKLQNYTKYIKSYFSKWECLGQAKLMIAFKKPETI